MRIQMDHCFMPPEEHRDALCPPDYTLVFSIGEALD